MKSKNAILIEDDYFVPFETAQSRCRKLENDKGCSYEMINLEVGKLKKHQKDTVSTTIGSRPMNDSLKLKDIEA